SCPLRTVVVETVNHGLCLLCIGLGPAGAPSLRHRHARTGCADTRPFSPRWQITMVRGSVSDRTLPGGVGAGLSLGSSGLAGALPDPEDASSFAQAERLKARIEAGAALPTIPFLRER
ncbi:MAG TPA: hypothetical protein VGR08_07530, partial [Thermomicrobiales bacterium]|nr:hypothetical protein [Thermomicrobiales bacterium]